MTDPIVILESSSEDCDFCVNVKPAKKRQRIATKPKHDIDLSSSDEEDFAIPASSIFASRGKQSEVPSRTVPKNHLKDLNRKDREECRKAERERRKEQKEKEKEERQAARQREKDERAMVRAATKQAKIDRKIAAQQQMGKFAQDEIALLINPKLFKDPEWKETFDKFYESYDSISESDGIDDGAIQFIRRNYVEGGATAALRALERNSESGFQLVHHLVIIFSNPNHFLSLMERSDTEDDYPKLEEWLEKKYALWKKKWPGSETPRVMILLPGLIEEVHQKWNDASRTEKQFLTTDVDVNDAIVWLQIAFRVEAQLLKNKEDVLDFLLKMTRSISEEPYAQAATELECVRKIKSTLEAGSQHSPLEIAQDTWIRMLQQVPKMSAARAESVAQYYPTARCLWQAYSNTENESERQMLVSHLMSENRQFKKVSEQLHRLMTTQDSKDLLI